jgi:flagellar basal-body rod protein FlgG
MLQGLYAAATGMMTLELQQDIVANNVANAATTGFRRQEAVQKGFYDLFVNKRSRPNRFNQNTAPGGGVKMEETYSDTSGGALQSTGNPLNVALTGPGFLSVNTPRGERFTRNGAFAIDSDGDLATADGYKVQGEGGQAVAVGEGVVTIGKDGSVSVNGAVVGSLRVTEFNDPHMLTREGEALYMASNEALQASQPAKDTTVEQSMLEMSNVNIPREMIAMLLGSRAYAANQLVINAVDQTVDRLIQQVGTPV